MHRIKSFYNRNKEWILPAFSGFVATVLGIVLTLGVSKVIDYKNARNMQRQCVYNVLSDIDNAITHIHKDSAFMAELAWLPDYFYRRVYDEPYSVDSLFDCFVNLYTGPAFLRPGYTIKGRNIMNSIAPANEMDMQLHRYMELTYLQIDKLQQVFDEINKTLDSILLLRQHLYYTPSLFDYSNKQVTDILLESGPVMTLSNITYQMNAVGYYSKYRASLEELRHKILTISGVTMEEYEAFCNSISDQVGDSTTRKRY